MKSRWENKVAYRFKERNNKVYIGPCLGKILTPLPDITIELLNGRAIIDKRKIYLSNAITNRLAIECTMKEFESVSNTFEDGSTGSASITTSGSGSTEKGGKVLSLNQNGSIKISDFKNNKENKEKGKFILQTVFNLLPGMYVLVIPNAAEDKFFVVDVFNHAPEVSLEWEYYQK